LFGHVALLLDKTCSFHRTCNQPSPHQTFEKDKTFPFAHLAMHVDLMNGL